AQLRPSEGGADRRVHVAVKHHERRRVVEELALHADEHAGRHHGLRARADAEVDVGLGQAELNEEHVRHPLVVVLPGGHDRPWVAKRGERADDRRGLDEVRPGPEYMRDRRAHSPSESPSRLDPLGWLVPGQVSHPRTASYPWRPTGRVYVYLNLRQFAG